MTMFKRLLALLLVLAISAGLCLSFVSCGSGDDGDQDGTNQGGNNNGGNNNGGNCTAHSDADHDGVCDTQGCGASVACNGTHVDTNNDGRCDIPTCNAVLTPALCTNHTDTNGDNVCDNAGCGAIIDASAKDYIVELKSVGGYKLSGIYLDLINADTGDLVAYGKTDADGRLTFANKKAANYVVAFGDGVPKGYVGQDEYVLNQNGATIIELDTKLLSSDLKGVTYKVGDIMHDFTLPSSDGTQVTLSELLKIKKAVVLNFWFIECSWCVEEFPDIQGAYELYSDEIEVVAINSTSDIMKDIAAFKDDLGLTFPMVKETDAAICNAFGFSNFPSTVIVDRYGMVTVMHSGAVLGTSYWEKLFDYFVADNYVSKTGTTFADLMPVEMPDVSQPSSDEIYNALIGSDVANDKNISFYPEQDPDSAAYSWPFVVKDYVYVDKNGNTVTDVCVSPSNMGKDSSFAIMYMQVNLKAGEAVLFEIHSSTESTENFSDVFYIIVDGEPLYSRAGYEGDGAWYFHNACAFVAEKDGTYEIAFTYLKDEADDGDLVDEFGNPITVDDTVYLKNLRIVSAEDIENLTYIYRAADEYITNDDLVLGTDGYYHIGTIDGPILLANLLAYTNFDRESTVSARLYSEFTLIIDGVEKAYHLELYANYASNSAVYGYVSVTPELREYLDAYARKYSSELKIRYDANTWLMICCYYNAYGKDAEGNPVSERPDPIKGLSTFSAYDVVETTDETDPQYNKVTYDRVIMPRGYLYKFVPTTSGVYRITSQSGSQVNAWIFTGSHEEWAENNGNRTLFLEGEQGERYNPDLLIDPDGDGVYERDFTNASMITYLEEGKEYYIAFGYYDVYEFSSFTFTVRRVADEFNAFFEASSGTFTYFENEDGSVGSIISGGINVILGEDGYYYHWKGNDADGNPILGSMVYADFLWTSNIFPTKTMQQLINAHAFNFALTENDLTTLAIVVSYSKQGFENEWLLEKYNTTDKSMTFEAFCTATKATDAWKAEFEARWESEGLAEIEYNLYNGIKCSGDLFDKVVEYTRDGFLDYYGIEEADDYWASYKVDEILEGKFHGKGQNYTLEMQQIYDELMFDENGDLIFEEDHPERQGCVPVNARLAELLQMLMNKYTFENVNNSWTKLCYYYEYLGPKAE